MLIIAVPLSESYNDETSEFAVLERFELRLEHSLVSLSKWESKWKIPFLSDEKKTEEQVLDYVRQMILGPVPSEEIFARLTAANIDAINDYIDDKMSATWFNEPAKRLGPSEVVTAEIIYYWMIALNIPFECQDWHLNRLLTLVKVCNLKNTPPDKAKPQEAMRNQRMLNEQRKRELGTTG